METLFPIEYYEQWVCIPMEDPACDRAWDDWDWFQASFHHANGQARGWVMAWDGVQPVPLAMHVWMETEGRKALQQAQQEIFDRELGV